MSERENRVPPFGIKDKLGYMFGDFGNDFTFIFASSFLIVFYTKVLKIDSSLVGVLFLSARFLDAVTDISMGRIVDASRGARDGRFKPWIRRMAGPVALASFLMYQSGMAGAPMAWRLVYMWVTYLLWGSIFYTSINIPYGSMASAITNQPEERASLSTFRSVGASLAGLVIGVGVPMVLYATDEAGNKLVIPSRFTLIAGVFSVLTVICYALCYYLTTERVKIQPDPDRPRITLGQTFGAIVHNNALLAIIVAAILLLLSQLVSQAMNNYLFIDYFKSETGQSLVSFISAGALLALAPFTVKISNSFGKKEAGAVSMLIAGITFLALYFLKIENAYVFCAISAVAYLGQGFFNLIVWAFITDVIDYQEVKTKSRKDGTVYAVYSFARKVGQALAGGLGGFALTAVGYNSSLAVQTPEVTLGIYKIATLVPGLAFLAVAAVIAFWYPLSKKMVKENNEELKRRREAASN